jgi:hypothetical protein
MDISILCGVGPGARAVPAWAAVAAAVASAGPPAACIVEYGAGVLGRTHEYGVQKGHHRVLSRLIHPLAPLCVCAYVS